MHHYKKTPTTIEGLFLIESEIFHDERGMFQTVYEKEGFKSIGISTEFVLDNISVSKKGVLRGLHFQSVHTQAKLVRVISGSIYDVAVDLRHDSSTFGHWYGQLLDSSKNKQIYIPVGCAHGFLALEDNTIIGYKSSDIYDPDFSSGVMPYDPDLAIDWEKYIPQDKHILRDKDLFLPSFREFSDNNPF